LLLTIVFEEPVLATASSVVHSDPDRHGDLDVRLYRDRRATLYPELTPTAYNRISTARESFLGAVARLSASPPVIHQALVPLSIAPSSDLPLRTATRKRGSEPASNEDEPPLKSPSHFVRQLADKSQYEKTEALVAVYRNLNRLRAVESADQLRLQKTEALITVYLALGQYVVLNTAEVTDGPSHVTTAQTSALAIAATAADGAAIAARPMPAVSFRTPPVSDAVRSLTERFNEAEGEAAQRILLHKAKILRLTAEEKTAFLQGVRDRGALVVNLISRFRGTCKGAKRKEKRKAI
jgi:hypothetical protein